MTRRRVRIKHVIDRGREGKSDCQVVNQINQYLLVVILFFPLSVVRSKLLMIVCQLSHCFKMLLKYQ